jgi:hypothetical protein
VTFPHVFNRFIHKAGRVVCSGLACSTWKTSRYFGLWKSVENFGELPKPSRVRPQDFLRFYHRFYQQAERY